MRHLDSNHAHVIIEVCPLREGLNLGEHLLEQLLCRQRAALAYRHEQVVVAVELALRVFDLEQLEALALLAVRVETQAENIGIVFFGIYCVLLGYLIYKSRFLPRVIGVLMAIAGLGWLTFLYPPLSSALWPYIAIPGLLGEGSLTVWLLVKGVNVSHRG